MARWRSLPASLLLLLSTALAERLAPRPRSFQLLPSSALTQVAKLSDPAPLLDFHDRNSLLAKILVPRPPGSDNLTHCQALFKSHFASLSTTLRVPSNRHLYDPNTHDRISSLSTWHLEEHSFVDTTPYGQQRFTNQIFTHDPSAPLKLVLSAHVDSKYFPTSPANQFVGATDSAAPVAIILQVAKALTPLLDAQLKDRLDKGPQAWKGRVTLQVVLLDGEEAFQQWTDSDSIYGARALAEKWSSVTHPPTAYSRNRNLLDSIQAFVLLDLLGSPQPYVSNYFHGTTWIFEAWSDAERRLGEAGVLWDGQKGDAWASLETGKGRPFFRPVTHGSNTFGFISDDHIPFLQRGVPVLHLIASPFPRVWHTLADNADALDLPTIKAWSLIAQTALVEYFGLGPYLDHGRGTPAERTASDLIPPDRHAQ